MMPESLKVSKSQLHRTPSHKKYGQRSRAVKQDFPKFHRNWDIFTSSFFRAVTALPWATTLPSTILLAQRYLCLDDLSQLLRIPLINRATRLRQFCNIFPRHGGAGRQTSLGRSQGCPSPSNLSYYDTSRTRVTTTPLWRTSIESESGEEQQSIRLSSRRILVVSLDSI
jgi:hypothetical protein